MSLCFWIYLTNFTNNAVGEFLESEDGITGFEYLTLANINGLPRMLRFELELDEAMEDVSSSRFLTLIIDFTATLVFIGVVTLNSRWRIFSSDFAVKLTNLNKDYKGDIEKEIKNKFEAKYGKIHEVAVINNTGNILRLQMQLGHVHELIGDTKVKNEYLGMESSQELLKLHKRESSLNEKLANEIKYIDSLKLEIGGTSIREVYIIFEMPAFKNKLIQNPVEISDFIDKVKNPSKKRFM